MTHLHVAERQHLLPPPRLTDLWATRPLIALWGGLAVLDVGRLVGLTPAMEVLAVAALVATCSYGGPRLGAVAIAVVGWLLVNGFVVHTSGQLGFTGTGDVLRAGVLLAVALLATAVRR